MTVEQDKSKIDIEIKHIAPNIEEVTGHVVFDFDGTLVKSMNSIFYHAAHLIGQHIGKDLNIEHLLPKLRSRGDMIFPYFGITDERIKRKILCKWEEEDQRDWPTFEPFPGIKELLTNLTKEKIKLYIWTARDRKSTLEILKYHGIVHFFTDLRGRDDTIPKPNPKGLMEMLGDVDPNNIVMIGDSLSDVQGANNFGCHSFGAVWCETACPETLKTNGAHQLLNGPEELLHKCLELWS